MKYNLLILISFFFTIAVAQVSDIDDCTSSVSTSAHGHMFSMLECDQTLTISSNSTEPISITGNFETSKTIFIWAGQSSVFLKPMQHSHSNTGDNSSNSTTGRHTNDPKTRIKVPPPTSGFFRDVKEDEEAIVETKNAVLLYPNPAKDMITIDCYNTITSLTIQNMHGVVVKALNYPSQNSTINLTVNDLNAGIYFVTVGLADETFYKKRIIKH